MIPPSRLLLALLAATALALPAAATPCDPAQDPTPVSTTNADITFYNDTTYPLRIYWAEGDGFLLPYSDWVQPGESQGYGTFVGHVWFVEINTPDGMVCSDPISANSPEGCQMHVLYDNGIGYDAGFCDF